MDSEQLSPVRWVGSSLKDLKSFPSEVKAEVGHALYVAQQGDADPAAKPLKGFGGVSIMEIVAPFDGNTWRTCIPSALEGLFTYCTLSRRNPSRASPLRRRTSI